MMAAPERVRSDGRAAGHVGCGNHRHERRTAVRVTDRELNRRKRPGRHADHRGAIDAEVIHQIHDGIRLMFRRRILRERRAQIAEPGGRDDPITRSDQRSRRPESLVEAATGAVDHEDRRTVLFPGHGVFHRAKAALKKLTSLVHPCALGRKIVGKGLIDGATPQQGPRHRDPNP